MFNTFVPPLNINGFSFWLDTTDLWGGSLFVMVTGEKFRILVFVKRA